jgi:hypothetical protein
LTSALCKQQDCLLTNLAMAQTPNKRLFGNCKLSYRETMFLAMLGFALCGVLAVHVLHNRGGALQAVNNLLSIERKAFVSFSSLHVSIQASLHQLCTILGMHTAAASFPPHTYKGKGGAMTCRRNKLLRHVYPGYILLLSLKYPSFIATTMHAY